MSPLAPNAPGPRLLQAALNGTRRRDEHPALPTTTAEVATAAAQCVAAGAGAIHVHVRDANGLETLLAGDVARWIEALRAAIPGTPIGVSTGEWIIPQARQRHHTVSGWTVQPDYASVNFHESGAEQLALLLLSRGTGIEVGIPEAVAAERLIRSRIASRCLRVLIEPQAQDLDAALRAVEEIEAVLDTGGITLPRLLHGLDHTAWPLIGIAAARGYDTRIGFEDTLSLADGSRAATNAALVEAARRVFP